jgi:coenzyme F420-reducing hydrogenase delta subunit
VAYVSDLLEEIGLGRERIRMVNMSSAMAVQFAEAVENMTQEVRELGPNPLRKTRDSDSEE